MRSLAPPPSQRTKVLHDRYAQPIFSYCLRRLRSREEAEDAAQIVFLNAHRCFQEGVEPQSERAWLFKIAEHVVMYRRRTIARRARVEFPVDVDVLADLVVAPEREVTPELSGLPGALARIPEAQQRAIVLREWYGLSYREVAAELGITVSATETLIFRARCRLAQELGGPVPTARRGRPPLSVASPLASLKWLLGGGTTVKALVGVTSVAVLAVGSAEVGLLPHPARPPAAAASQRSVAPAAMDASSLVFRLRASVAAAARARKARARAQAPLDPAPVAVDPAAAPLAVTADPTAEAATDPASVTEPAKAAAVAELSTTTDVAAPQPSAVDSAAEEPVDTKPPDPGQSGDVQGPSDNAASGQAQRSSNVPPAAPDPGNQGHGTPGAAPGGNGPQDTGNASANGSSGLPHSEGNGLAGRDLPDLGVASSV